jgi:8-oxo-dGTP pyrophosphatase MutT (NUDIX family)
MDLSIQLENIKLNIRVAVLLRTKKGYLFEQGKNGYLFTLGGRVKAGESSVEAAKREVFEEIGFNIGNINLIALVENFFGQAESSVQEICFVYEHEGNIDIDLPANFLELEKEEMLDKDIRPEIIKKIITDPREKISHYVIK